MARARGRPCCPAASAVEVPTALWSASLFPIPSPPRHFPNVRPQCFPSEGPQLLAPALQCLLADLLSGRESGLVVAASLGVFARVLLHNPSAFLSLFQAAAAAGVAPPADAAAPAGADPPARLLLALVDLWLDKFDCIGQPAARKLSALALAVLLTAPLPPLLERLELVVTHITSVWFEVGGRVEQVVVFVASGGAWAGLRRCRTWLNHSLATHLWQAVYA